MEASGRSYGERLPVSKVAIVAWVKGSFGGLLTGSREPQLSGGGMRGSIA
jgi:hypothetical protein